MVAKICYLWGRGEVGVEQVGEEGNGRRKGVSVNKHVMIRTLSQRLPDGNVGWHSAYTKYAYADIAGYS